MSLFDAYLVVDWSASSTPKTGADSIWVCLAVRGVNGVTIQTLQNPSTRAAARDLTGEVLVGLVADARRTLVGFDFPYGYPAGLAAALAAPTETAAWRATWDRLSGAIQDNQDNQNNRFVAASDLNAALGAQPGPFWGCPAASATQTLNSTGCGFPYEIAGHVLQRLRIAEQRLAGTQESWKLWGIGSVGSQALVGIPRVASLRDDEALAPVSKVWPFETGFTARVPPKYGPFIVHAEIWPGIVPVDTDLHQVRDAAQVLTLARYLASLDDAGELASWFAQPNDLAPHEVDACLNEEGWILGA